MSGSLLRLAFFSCCRARTPGHCPQEQSPGLHQSRQRQRKANTRSITPGVSGPNPPATAGGPPLREETQSPGQDQHPLTEAQADGSRSCRLTKYLLALQVNRTSAVTLREVSAVGRDRVIRQAGVKAHEQRS